MSKVTAQSERYAVVGADGRDCGDAVHQKLGDGRREYHRRDKLLRL
jgi:hypothetical protein